MENLQIIIIFERRNEEEVSTSKILRDSTSRRILEESTCGRIFRDHSYLVSNEEDDPIKENTRGLCKDFAKFS